MLFFILKFNLLLYSRIFRSHSFGLQCLLLNIFCENHFFSEYFDVETKFI